MDNRGSDINDERIIGEGTPYVGGVQGSTKLRQTDARENRT
jgi:hypothetical protein